MKTLVLIEHDRGCLAAASLEALTAARALSDDVHALTLGAAADSAASTLAAYGACVVYQVHHELLDDYNPEAWGAALSQAITTTGAAAVLSSGTDRGNEVLAHAAARLGLPFVANCIEIVPGEPWTMVRVRWGGSLLERCTLHAGTAMVSVARHSLEAVEQPADGTVRQMAVELDPMLRRTMVVGRVERAAGVTLATAALVVGGGRGVGSAEGFAPLEELAAELGGVVGCSRAVTNNGWRNHAEQVGQTGTRIAPDLYIACGISGAIQHWVGAMASKKILAINTDPEANMVTKADYAVIGDLHQVVPAITAEVRRRRT